MDNVLLQANIMLSQGQWSRSKSEGPKYEYKICVNVNGNHGGLVACTHKKIRILEATLLLCSCKNYLQF